MSSVIDPQDLRERLKDLFARPDLLPEPLLAFLVDYLGVNQPLIPIGQVMGFSGFTAQSAQVSASVSTSSASYVSLAGGPSLTGLAAGNYLILHGSAAKASVAGSGALQSVSINSASGSDDDSALTRATVGEESIAMATAKKLSNENNSVEVIYRSSDATSVQQFLRRWLIVLRYSNL